MRESVRKSDKTGLPPGALIHVGELKSNTSTVTVCGYDNDLFWVEKTDDLKICLSLFEQKAPVLWVHIDGLANIELLEGIGSHFNLHHLTLEDILNADQRPRQEPYEDYTYLVLKSVFYNEKEQAFEFTQISLVIGQNFVISISDCDTSIFEPLKKRIAAGKGNIRMHGSDYLAYSLIDIVVDSYYAVLENFGEKLDSLEESLLKSMNDKTLHSIHFYKREMFRIRQAVWPLREALNGLIQSDSVFIHAETNLHLRDVYSHAVQIIDSIEIYREMLSAMTEIYLSIVNNKLNEVMKILTIFAAIFIPLTLISGIYGMNFLYMPELSWRYGYLFALSLMAVVAAVLLCYFKRKRWL
jgi:magnesium transporter